MKKKRSIWLIVGVLIVLGLTGCGRQFDAKTYVEATLNLVTRHEVDEYAKATGMDVKETEEIYQKNIAALDEVFGAMEKEGVSKETNQRFQNYIFSALKKSKYTVEEAQKEGKDGTYVVSVKVKPLLVGKEEYGVAQKEITSYMEQIKKDMEAGKEAPKQEEVNEKIFSILVEAMEKGLEKPTYGKEKTVKVHVEKNKENKYEIVSEDFMHLGSMLITIEEIQS